MTEARRTLDWEKQLALSIDPENAAKIHGRTGQQREKSKKTQNSSKKSTFKIRFC